MKTQWNNLAVGLLLLLSWPAAAVPEQQVRADELTPRRPRPVPGRALAPVPPAPPAEKELLERVFRRFPDADVERVTAFLRQQFPQGLREARTLALRHVEEAVEALSQMVGEAMDLLERQRTDPEGFEKRLQQMTLERRAAALSERYRVTAAGAREAVRDEMRQLLDQAFTIKQDLMQRDIEQMAAELERLKALVDKREQNRAAIVERRIDQLTGQGDPLDW